MKLQVFHRTHYAYASPVRESFNEARLQPTNADGQICHSFTLTVDPATQLNHYLDFQFNWVHLFDVNEPHSALTVEATSVVTTSAEQVLPEDHASTPLAEMDRSCGRLERCNDFLQASRFVEPSPEAWRLGLVNRVVPRAELTERVDELADRVALVPPVTAQVVKDSLNNTATLMGKEASWKYHFMAHHWMHNTETATSALRARQAKTSMSEVFAEHRD